MYRLRKRAQLSNQFGAVELETTGCAKKVTPFWYLSFLPLLDALFAIFVYLHIIFIKCLISEPSVVSSLLPRDGLTSRMVHHRTLRKTR